MVLKFNFKEMLQSIVKHCISSLMVVPPRVVLLCKVSTVMLSIDFRWSKWDVGSYPQELRSLKCYWCCIHVSCWTKMRHVWGSTRARRYWACGQNWWDFGRLWRGRWIILSDPGSCDRLPQQWLRTWSRTMRLRTSSDRLFTSDRTRDTITDGYETILLKFRCRLQLSLFVADGSVWEI